MSSIKEELLEKAQIDRSKLVQVQRPVSRNGKQFMQNFWVKPSEVKSTDKVIGGQQNLLPAMGSVPKPAAGVLDKAYFDMLAANDKKQALDYLKSCNVSWDEHSHAGINWMRAMGALKTALGGQGTKKVSNQPNSQPQPQTQQTAQNNQSGTSNGVFDKISSAQQAMNAELKDCKNGREKVVVMKKHVGADGVAYIAEQLGVDWSHSNHPAINWMHLAAALQKHFDETDGTTSPSNGGAPKGNKNAQKATKNPDELVAPANATQRTKNIIEAINKVTDLGELESFTSIGMVPEDDVSKSFILQKLALKYAIFANTHLKRSSSSKTSRYNSNTAWGFADQIFTDLNYEGLANKSARGGFSYLYDGFRMSIFTNPRQELSMNYGDYYSKRDKCGTSFGIITDFHEGFSEYTTDDYKDNLSHHYMTNMGYTGFDPAVYAERYDKEKEGFVRALRHLQETQPELKETCDTMIETYDSIMEDVGHNPNMLKLIMNQYYWDDTSTLDDIINGTNGYSGRKSMYSLMSDFGRLYSITSRLQPCEAQAIIEVGEEQYERLTKYFESRGMSPKAVVNTLNTYWSDSPRTFSIRDDNNNTVETVNLNTETLPDGTPVLTDGTPADELNCFMNKYIARRYITEKGLAGDSDYSYLMQTTQDSAEVIEYYKQVASFSGEDYLKVQTKIASLFGMKATKKNNNTGLDEDVDFLTLSAKTFNDTLDDCKVVAADSDTKKDAVISNLIMMQLHQRIQGGIVDNISENVASKLNNGGGDYSGNYTYYLPQSDQQSADDRKRQSGGGWRGHKIYTVEDLNKQLDHQMSQIPTFSSDYISHISDYYNAKSGYDDMYGEARKATMASVGINYTDYRDTPLKDILYTYTNAVAQYIPKMNERGSDKLATLMAKRQDYSPYDFSSATQRGFGSPTAKKASASTSKSELRKAREELLKATHCTISVEDEATSLQMRKDFMRDWDYRDNHTETTPDGIAHSTGRMYSGPGSWGGYDRRALFNSRFFRVNNSNMEDDFETYQSELKADTTLDSSASENLELYHACSYAGAAGILGKTGGWFMGNQYTKTAKALGNGAYFGFKGGKSSVYCGEGSGGYHNTSLSGANGDNANGCYILATVMRGKSGDSQSDHGRFRDYEIAVKSNKCIKPHHFVDISARSLDVNVRRDSKGNYIDPNTGAITHDRYGQKIDMK